MFIIIFLIFPLILFAQYERPGSTDAQFLKIGVSPRAAALGEAYISVVDNAEAAFYNPAALPLIKNMGLAFTHTEWFAGINHEFASIVKNVGIYGAFGFAVTALYTDEMKVRTPLQPDGTGETFYAGNYRFGLSYARRLTDHVSMGGTFYYIHMSLYQDFDANAMGGDVAVLYTSPFRGFRFGMKIANFGSEIKYVNEQYPQPTYFQFGLSMNAIQAESQTLLVSFSAVKPNDDRPLSRVGAEWNWNKTIFLRAGYHLNHDVARFAFGGGLNWHISDYTLRFDYSYSDFSLLGGAHRFGIGFDF
ncbi:MAG: hypothetical protein Kow0042_06210 [Calditrichia bacterium]